MYDLRSQICDSCDWMYTNPKLYIANRQSQYRKSQIARSQFPRRNSQGPPRVTETGSRNPPHSEAVTHDLGGNNLLLPVFRHSEPTSANFRQLRPNWSYPRLEAWG